MKRHFILRIELHNLPTEDSRSIYEFLRNELLRKGYTKSIPSRDGNKYNLPDAMYYGWSKKSTAEFTANNASNLAQQAVATTIAFAKETYPLTTMYGSDIVIEAVADVSTFEAYWHNLTKE